MAATKGRGANSSTCLSFKYKASFRKGTRSSNISSGLVWHVRLCFRVLSLLYVCGAVCVLLLSWRPQPQNTGVRKKDETAAMEMCWELCLTKCSNIILSSRISTHASKVHLSCLSLSKRCSRCGLVSMATVCIIQPGPFDFSFRCNWVTALTGNMLLYTQCYELCD